jgi:hypothetical protein
VGRQENLRKVETAWKCCDKAHQLILQLLSKAEYSEHEDLAKGFDAVRFMLVECKKILFYIYERMKG